MIIPISKEKCYTCTNVDSGKGQYYRRRNPEMTKERDHKYYQNKKAKRLLQQANEQPTKKHPKPPYHKRKDPEEE